MSTDGTITLAQHSKRRNARDACQTREQQQPGLATDGWVQRRGQRQRQEEGRQGCLPACLPVDNGDDDEKKGGKERRESACAAIWYAYGMDTALGSPFESRPPLETK